ncbi:MFS transporter [Streptomyces tendae]
MATVPVDASGAPESDVPEADDTGRMEGASRRRVIWTMLAIAASTEVVIFYVVFISMVAPYIGADFPSAGNQLAWMSTIFSLVGVVAVPFLGKLSDRFGKKRLMVMCLSAALVGAVLAAVTTSWTLFLLGRALQGLSFPAIAISYGLMRDLVPRRYVTTAIAVVGGGTGLAALIGPLAGTALNDAFGWRSLFWFCAVWSIATILALALWVPETRLRVRSGLDVLGTILLGGGAALVLIYLSMGGNWGWGEASSLACLIGGLALLGGFALWESKAKDPIMDPKLLRSRPFLAVLVVSCLCNAFVQGKNYVTSYLAQTPGGAEGEAIKQQIVTAAASAAAKEANIPASELASMFTVKGELVGLNMTLVEYTLQVSLGMALISVIASPLVGWLSTRISLQRLIGAAMAVFTLAFLLLVFFHASAWELGLLFALAGLGGAFYLGTAPNMLLEAVPQEQQGVSAGMYGAMNSLGASLSTVLITVVMAANPLVLHSEVPGRVSDTPLDTGLTAQLATGTAYTQLFAIFAGIAIVGFVLTLFMRYFSRPATGGVRL